MDSLSKGSIGSNFDNGMHEGTDKKHFSNINLMNYKTLATKKDNFSNYKPSKVTKNSQSQEPKDRIKKGGIKSVK